MVWEHVTPSDRNVLLPTTSVLMRMPDRRVQQFWDADRLLSKLMVRALPMDTLRSVAEIDTVGREVVWDCVSVYRPGLRWETGFPVPDRAGRPVYEVADRVPEWLAALADTAKRAGSPSR